MLLLFRYISLHSVSNHWVNRAAAASRLPHITFNMKNIYFHNEQMNIRYSFVWLVYNADNQFLNERLTNKHSWRIWHASLHSFDCISNSVWNMKSIQLERDWGIKFFALPWYSISTFLHSCIAMQEQPVQSIRNFDKYLR